MTTRCCLLKTGDLSAMEASLRALFASIAHDWYRNNPLAGFEGHYASVFYSHFAALGHAEKYRDRGEPVLLVGVEFGRVERNIVGFDIEPA